MPWPLIGGLLERIEVARADKLFPDPDPNGNLTRLLLTREDEPTRARMMAAARDPDALPQHALELALADIGKGETEGNNLGDYVAECVQPGKPPLFWCAGAVGRWYAMAADDLFIELPFKRSLGAKRLGKNVAAVGRKFLDPADALPGDLLILHRGDHGSTMGHVAIIEDVDKILRGTVSVVEANAGGFPAKVRRHVYALATCRLAFFASLRR